jgi:hypothetical protein
MRRLIGGSVCLLAFFCLTAPSQGGWFLHHGHYGHQWHHGAYPAYAAQPFAQPLTFGFQLPGGTMLNVTPDGSILQHLLQMRQGGATPPAQTPPGKVTVSSDVATAVEHVESNVGKAADKLDDLIKRIKDYDKTSTLTPIERSKQGTSGSDKSVGGGQKVVTTPPG